MNNFKKYFTSKSKQETLPNIKMRKVPDANISNNSSNYSTCSDNFNENDTLQSTILAGQILFNSNSTQENSSVGILDQNLDFISDSDHFLDCDESNNDDSVICLDTDVEFKQDVLASDKLKTKNSNEDYERLMTIMEETEVSNLTNQLNDNVTRDILATLINQRKSYSKISPTLKITHEFDDSASKITFSNIRNENFNYKQVNKQLKKKVHILKPYNLNKTPETLVVNNCGLKSKKNKDENFNICDKSKSSVIFLEERHQYTLNASILTKSFSCSDLSNISNLSYDGDNELSITVKKNNISQSRKYYNTRYSKYKSKSCESLLKEVKNLPHVLYNKFLKELSKEIEEMRKENVFCNCPKANKSSAYKNNSLRKPLLQKATNNCNENLKKQKPVPSKTNSSKEVKLSSPQVKNTDNKLKVNSKQLINCNENLKKQKPIPPKTNSSKEVKLSLPQVKNTDNKLNVNSKGLINSNLCIPVANKTLKPKALYNWQKEIVSPVKEYIEGKRPSPYKPSQIKKKL